MHISCICPTLEGIMSNKLIKFLEIIGALLVGLLFLTILTQIISRVFLSIPSTWTVEVGRALFLCIVFFISPVVLFRKGLMAINSLHDLTKGNGRCFLDLLNDLLIDIILAILAFGCYERTIETWTVEIPTVEWMKSGYLYLIMLIGTMLMLFFSVRSTIARMKEGR